MSTLGSVTPSPITIGTSRLEGTGHEAPKTEGTGDQQRVSITRERGVTARQSLDVGHVGEKPLTQVKDAKVQEAPITPKSSTLKNVLKTIGKVALVAGLITAGVMTGGAALLGVGIALGAAALLHKGIGMALSSPMRTQVFGNQDQRTDNVDNDQRKIARLPNAAPTTITTSSGETMKGNFFSPGSSGGKGVPDLTKPVVLLLTGSHGTAQSQGVDLAKMYSTGDPEANVLSMNYRGFGDSEGGLPSKDSVYKDGHAMFNHLLELGFKPEQIIIHGYSMGGAVAGKLAQSCESRGMQLKGVVYDRPMTSVYDAGKAHTKKDMGSVGSSIAGMVGRWGVGPMDTKHKVGSMEGNSTTKVMVTHDTEVLGPNAKKMGEDLVGRIGERAQVVSTGTEHMNNEDTVKNIGARFKAMVG